MREGGRAGTVAILAQGTHSGRCGNAGLFGGAFEAERAGRSAVRRGLAAGEALRCRGRACAAGAAGDCDLRGEAVPAGALGCQPMLQSSLWPPAMRRGGRAPGSGGAGMGGGAGGFGNGLLH